MWFSAVLVVVALALVLRFVPEEKAVE